MASIAIARPNLPSLADLREAVARPQVQVAAAASLFAACAAAVVVLLGPGASRPVRIHLGPVFAQAPAGWREALRPASLTWRSEENHRS